VKKKPRTSTTEMLIQKHKVTVVFLYTECMIVQTKSTSSPTSHVNDRCNGIFVYTIKMLLTHYKFSI